MSILLDRCTYIGKRAEDLMVIVPMFHTGGIRPKEMQDQLLFSKQHFSFCNFFLFPYNSIFLFIVLFGPKSKGECKKILRGKCLFFDVLKQSTFGISLFDKNPSFSIEIPPFR